MLGWLPLRFRITLWVLAIFAVVHVTLSLVVVLFQRQAVEREIRADLIETAEDVGAESLGDIPGFLMIRVVQHAKAAQWGPLASVVFADDGTQVVNAGPYEPEQFAALRTDALRHVGRDEPTVFEPDAGEFLYAMTTLPDGQNLVVAAPASEMRRSLDPTAFVLLLTLPIGLISTGVATWYMSGIAVRPLRQVQDFARDLSAENVSQDIDMDDDSPEVEHLRDELEAAMARLRKGYERQARFLANVSHELKTPVSVVRTEAEVLLAAGSGVDDYRAFARSAAEEMDRLGRMIESFLLLTRVRQGAARIKAARHDANDILMEALGYSAAMASQYDVTIAPTLHVPDHAGDDELTVEGNADLLQTAVANLVRNAIRFSPKDGSIELACERVGDRVEFSVRDYGPGVPPEVIDRIFEPFTQSDEERRRGRGTGLGLQIAQGIAEMHGGSISVVNLDRGCRFTLSVPIRAIESEHADEGFERDPGSVPGHKTNTPPRNEREKRREDQREKKRASRPENPAIDPD